MSKGPIYPGNKLTVIIRNDAPMIHCGDSPSYRSVQIALTEEQMQKLRLNYAHSSGGNDFHEDISKCFIE